MPTLTRPTGIVAPPSSARPVDLFAIPAATTSIADAQPRARVVLDARVARVERCEWVGGPVLEVTVEDGTGRVLLAFLGRRGIAGVERGRRLVAAGTVGAHMGRAVVRNPIVWLQAE